MRLFWNSFARQGKDETVVRIIWAERYPDMFEVHSYPDGNAILYLNSREIGSGRDILELTAQAESMVLAPEDVAA